MTLKNENGKYLTWEFVAVTLITLVLCGLGYFLQDVQGQVRSKVDKQEYSEDMKRVEGKLDYIIDLEIKEKR
jgi:flagellar biosynthesis protein FlhB